MTDVSKGFPPRQVSLVSWPGQPLLLITVEIPLGLGQHARPTAFRAFWRDVGGITAQNGYFEQYFRLVSVSESEIEKGAWPSVIHYEHTSIWLGRGVKIREGEANRRTAGGIDIGSCSLGPE
ncbi:hypothetical protein SBA3_670032 [Candidatus Sulfopaludibacter sp. SbA3]|nr:hypothetical protein SBA3_670032 [Candidatus Sulfopaludibacter sp. SbA3]